MKNTILILLILLSSCAIHPASSEKDFNKSSLLTNDSVKYWNAYWKIPYFIDSPYYNESGLAFYRNGLLIEYHFNEENKRVINKGSDDVICDQTTFYLKSNKITIKECGYKSVFKIEKLTKDTLQLKEVTNNKYFLNRFNIPDSVPKIYIISRDQYSRPIIDTEDYSNGPVKVKIINK